jgi:hypothetical protein
MHERQRWGERERKREGERETEREAGFGAVGFHSVSIYMEGQDNSF